MVALAEIHEDLVPISVAEKFFGPRTLSAFRDTYPGIQFRDGYIGKGDRSAAVRRRAVAAEKLDRAHALVKEISGIPWLLFVGVTGSVAFGNARKEDDIDLFLVTRDRRLWITRLVEQAIYRRKGVRRTFGMKDVSDKICINTYVSEHSLDVRPVPVRRFEIALELAMMQPIYNKPYYAKILSENEWVYEYVPNLRLHTENRQDSDQAMPSRPSPILDFLDLGAMAGQYGYMKLMRHPWESVRMSRNNIHFYNRASWSEKREKVADRLQRYDV